MLLRELGFFILEKAQRRPYCSPLVSDAVSAGISGCRCTVSCRLSSGGLRRKAMNAEPLHKKGTGGDLWPDQVTRQWEAWQELYKNPDIRLFG